LEILVQGPLLEIAGSAVRVALFGDECGLRIEGEQERRVPAGRSVRLTRGERMRIAALERTFCAYLAVEGGFDVAPCLGSAATYTRNRLGGFEGRALQTGDVLPIRGNEAAARPELALPQAC